MNLMKTTYNSAYVIKIKVMRALEFAVDSKVSWRHQSKLFFKILSELVRLDNDRDNDRDESPITVYKDGFIIKKASYALQVEDEPPHLELVCVTNIINHIQDTRS